jgi:hypothetical protein
MRRMPVAAVEALDAMPQLMRSALLDMTMAMMVAVATMAMRR